MEKTHQASTSPSESESGDTHLDTRMIEVLGRGCLIDQLLQAGLEVALPERNRGVDLIAYADPSVPANRFSAKPIQMKAASKRGFSLDQKYERISDLIMAYVWHVDAPQQTVIYALTYDQAFSIAEELGWTRTASWAKGNYFTSSPSKQIEALLEPFRMTPTKWRELVVGGVSHNDGASRGAEREGLGGIAVAWIERVKRRLLAT